MLFYYFVIAIPLLSATSAFLYGLDKHRARQDSRRIPESTLLGIDLLGGWPGGWWAQYKFRHKTQKVSFRIRFMLAVAINIIAVGGWCYLRYR